MAILFFDGFEHFTSAIHSARKWSGFVDASNANVAAIVAGRAGVGALRGKSGADKGGVWYNGPAGAATSGCCGCALKLDEYPTASPFGGSLYGTVFGIAYGGTLQIGLAILPDGSLQFVSRVGGSGYTYAVYSISGAGPYTSGLTLGDWHYIECKWTIDATSGTVECRVDGAVKGTWTGCTRYIAVNSWNGVYFATPDSFSGYTPLLSNTSVNKYWYMDDCYVKNDTTYLGDVRVDAHYPTADGTTHTFTPSTGSSHFALVDETAPNDDTDYNTAVTAALKDTFIVEALKNPGAAIKAVQLTPCVKKADVGAATICTVVRHNGTDYDGTTQYPPATNYIYMPQVYETNPGTGVAWTESGFNNAEFGYKKVA